MARYGTEHKEATRRRIIETAGRRLQAGRHRRVRRRHADGRRRAHQRSLLRPLRLQGRPRRDGRRGPARSTGVGVQRAAGRPRRTRGLRARVLVACAPGPPRPRLPVGSTARRGRAVHRERPRRRTRPAPRRSWTRSARAWLRRIRSRRAERRSCCSRCSSGSMQLARALSDKKLSDAVLEEGIRSARSRFSAPGRGRSRRRARPR